ncbi:MAG: peptidylprolyl isomerase [Planctomycetota bacterium]|nr:peptidylprolyl isomerase [Planctomycetota bacterium]MDA1143201.1 peptidylprolyl isomerase [Planctomycetota bacterium]
MPVTVNGEFITDDEIYAEYNRLRGLAEQGPEGLSCCEGQEEYHEMAKENMITRVLLAQEAGRQRISVAQEKIDAAIEKLRAENEGNFQFEASLTCPQDRANLESNIQTHLVIEQLLDSEVGGMPVLSEEQVEQYYNDNLDSFVSPPKIHVKHILKSLDHGAGRRSSYNELVGAREKLGAGEDFQELCDQHSDRPGEESDLGWFSPGEIAEEFEAVVFSMKKDEISPVFMTPFGYHIATVLGREEPAPYPLEQIKEQVHQIAAERMRLEKIAGYVETLKAKAEIEETEVEV